MLPKISEGYLLRSSKSQIKRINKLNIKAMFSVTQEVNKYTISGSRILLPLSSNAQRKDQGTDTMTVGTSLKTGTSSYISTQANSHSQALHAFRLGCPGTPDVSPAT